MHQNHASNSSLNKVEEAVKFLLESNLLNHEKIAVLGAIRRILYNIIQHPLEEKYRILNRQSQSYIKKILFCGSQKDNPAERVLLQCGFTDAITYEAFNSPESKKKLASKAQHLVIKHEISTETLQAYITLLDQYIDRCESVTLPPSPLPSTIASPSPEFRQGNDVALRLVRGKLNENYKGFKQHSSKNSVQHSTNDSTTKQKACSRISPLRLLSSAFCCFKKS